MHILFFTHYFPPEVNAPASRTYEHAKYWMKAGHKVTVITNHPNHPHGQLYDGYQNKLISREEIDGINVVRLWTFLAANSGVVKRTLNYIIYAIFAFFAGLRMSKYDIIIGTTPQFFCALSGLLVAKIKGKPFIGEVRDLWPDSIVAVGAMKESWVVKSLHYLERLFYRHSDHLVVLTRSFARHVESLCDTPHAFIPNGVDWDLWKPDNVQQNGNIMLQKGTFKVGYIGTFGMAHGLEVVLDVAKLTKDHPDIHYYLIGDGAEKTKLQNRIHNEEISNLCMYGLQPKKSVPAILDQLDVLLVLLKREEIFKTVIPSKLFEGMVMSKPLIVGIEGETKEIIQDSGSGITIMPESKEELQKAVVDLYKNPELRKTLGQNGQSYITKYFLREKLAEKYLSIFEELRQ